MVEHDLDVIRHADWIVDVGPGAGEQGGYVLYSGPPAGLATVEASVTRRYLFGGPAPPPREPRAPKGGCGSPAITRNNLNELDVDFPWRVHRGHGSVRLRQVEPGQPRPWSNVVGSISARDAQPSRRNDDEKPKRDVDRDHRERGVIGRGHEGSSAWCGSIRSRSGARRARTLATYTGLFDHVRKLFAATRKARAASRHAGGFPSTSPRDAARIARAKAS